MIKLYHISYDLSEPLEKTFIPKIPGNPEFGEDESICRICLSDSIEGCINAAEDKLWDKQKNNITTIIVWEKQFDLSDEKLKSWEYLYENNLVSDAALTHEYWYLDQLNMKGSFYEILNVSEAYLNRTNLYVINPKYKGIVFKVLADNGVKMDNIKDYDLCTLINEWLPINLPSKKELIIKSLKKEMTIISEIDEENADLYRLCFGNGSKLYEFPDYYKRKVFNNLKIKKKEI